MLIAHLTRCVFFTTHFSHEDSIRCKFLFIFARVVSASSASRLMLINNMIKDFIKMEFPILVIPVSRSLGIPESHFCVCIEIPVRCKKRINRNDEDPRYFISIPAKRLRDCIILLQQQHLLTLNKRTGLETVNIYSR